MLPETLAYRFFCYKFEDAHCYLVFIFIFPYNLCFGDLMIEHRLVHCGARRAVTGPF